MQYQWWSYILLHGEVPAMLSYLCVQYPGCSCGMWHRSIHVFFIICFTAKFWFCSYSLFLWQAYVLFLQHLAQLFLRIFLVISCTTKYSCWCHTLLHGKLPVLFLWSVGWRSILAVLTVCHNQEYLRCYQSFTIRSILAVLTVCHNQEYPCCSHSLSHWRVSALFSQSVTLRSIRAVLTFCHFEEYPWCSHSLSHRGVTALFSQFVILRSIRTFLTFCHIEEY